MAGHFELMNCTAFLLGEIADDRLAQKDIELSYALALRSSEATDWEKVNAAIIARWSKSGLERIKKAAWKPRVEAVSRG